MAQVGVERPAEIHEASTSEFSRFFDVNVKGTFLCTKHVSRAMRMQDASVVASKLGYASRDVGRGSIINLGSANSFIGTGSLVQYVTAKHAVLGITKTAGKLQQLGQMLRTGFLFLWATSDRLTAHSGGQCILWHSSEHSMPIVG